MSDSTSAKTAFLRLIEGLDDDSALSSEEAASEARAKGIDLDDATQRLDTTLRRVINARRRKVLDEARRSRLSDRFSSSLAAIQAMRLPLSELNNRITQLSGLVAHRELSDVSREDLESQLADLMDLNDGE